MMKIIDISAQLSCLNCAGRDTTSYTNAYENDSLYFICQGETASLRVSWSSGELQNVQWYRFISTSNVWTPISAQNQVDEAVYNATPGGFRVVVTDTEGAITYEEICWVSRINSPPIVNANTLQPGCGPVQLTGLYIPGNITGYYNPPPANFNDPYLFSSNSEIELCLNITHPILADLNIELVSPPACGSQSILLTATQTPDDPDSICYNSDAVGLCFSNTSSVNYNLCELSNFDVSGTYGAYGTDAELIDWDLLEGCDVTQPGWSIHIRDCFGGANGSLVSATLTVQDMTEDGVPVSHEFLPLEGQDFTILDTGCDSSLYTVIALERIYPEATLLSQGIGIVWETSPPIELPNNGAGLNIYMDPGPTEDVLFYLRLSNIELGGACGSISSDVEPFDYIEPDSTIITITDSILCLTDPAMPVASSIAEGEWSGPLQFTEQGILFDPAVVGSGLWTIAFEPVSACIDATEVTVFVDAAPQLSLSAPSAFCETDTAAVLAAFPPGGYWIGEGVVDSIGGVFNASLVTSENTLLTYRVEGNCPIENTVSIAIESFVPLQINQTDTVLCELSEVLSLSANLGSLIWNGPGILSSTGSFNPSVAGVGDHEVVAMYEQACVSNDTLSIRVEDSSIQLIAPDPVCVNAEPQALQVIAGEGVWSGAGVIDSLLGIVDPVALGAGAHYVLYTLNNACASVDSVALMVQDFPDIQLGLPEDVCVDLSDFMLLANYEGGDFSGNGVYSFGNNWYFTPQLAGAGTWEIQYDYSDVCTLTVLDTIDVHPLPELTVASDTIICPEGQATLYAIGAFNYGWAPAATVDTPQESVSLADPDITTTYTVTGESNFGCFAVEEVVVEVLESPEVSITGPLEICPGESVILESTGLVSAEWLGPNMDSPLELSTIVSPDQTSTYQVLGFDQNGCAGQSSVEVVVIQPSAFFIASDTLATPPLEVQFTNLSNGNYFIWDFGNGDSLVTQELNASVVSTYTGEGISTVFLTAYLNGCPATYSLSIETYYDSELLVVPNVVTPNGDGKNDSWRIETQNMADMHIDIFNRWGTRVAELQGITDKWVPDENAAGTYYFHLFATGLDGEAYNRDGHITVMSSEN
jgi:gliding motility-associated-like protein